MKMPMRTLARSLGGRGCLAGWTLLMGCCGVLAKEFRFSQSGAWTVPDGGGVGAVFQQRVEGLPGPTVAVRVALDIEGGWNGDLYAFLAFGDGLAVLLNRPGRAASDLAGYGDSGFRVLLEDTATGGDIHRYRDGGLVPSMLGADGALLGTWAPDGRLSDPDVTMGTEARTALLSRFSGMDPNGVWTLFVADMESGGVAVLRGWELRIEVMTPPEGPVAVTDELQRPVGAGLKVRPSVLLANDVGSQGGTLTLVGVEARSAGGGRVRLSEGWVVYEPGVPGALIDSFHYTVREPGGREAQGLVIITAVSPETGPTRNIGSATLLPGGNIRLTGHGIPGRTYRVESTENLAQGPWTGIGDAIVDSAGTWRIDDPRTASGASRFYRAIQ